MTPETKHTPTPWRYDGEAYIFGPANEMVAEIRGHGARLPMEENAVFIVCAVNAHDELLRALKGVTVLVETLLSKHAANLEDSVIDHTLEEANKAIAKAGG